MRTGPLYVRDRAVTKATRTPGRGCFCRSRARLIGVALDGCRAGAYHAVNSRSSGEQQMAKIVLGIATSHTPMLNTPAKDWPSFIDRDGVRDFLDKEGEPATYEELLCRPDPRAAAELTSERFRARHDEAQAAIDHL